MKKRVGGFMAVFLIFLLIIGNIAVAEDEFTDYLKLSSYNAGDKLGENLVVAADEDAYYKKWITGDTGNGKLTVKPVALSDEFELFVKFKGTSYQEIYLASEEESIRLWFYSGGIGVNNSQGIISSWRSNDANDIRLYVNGTTAKVYLNDVFCLKTELDKAGLTYTSLLVKNLPNYDFLYELKSRNIQPVKDCSGVIGGSAYVDDCGNCAGGTSGQKPCATVSEFDYLKLSSYKAGDKLGENLVVAEDEDAYYQKWVTGDTGNGKLTVKPVALSDEFELFVKFKGTSYQEIYLASEEESIRLWFYSGGIGVNNSQGIISSWRSNDANDIRLYVNGTTAKVYLNDVFCLKTELDKAGLTYTSLLVKNLPNYDFLYELRGRNLQRTSQPAKDCAGVIGGTAYFDSCGICVGGTTGVTPCVSEYQKGYDAGYTAGKAGCGETGFSCDVNGDKKTGLPEAVYILQIIAGLRDSGTKTLTSVSVSGSSSVSENSSADYKAAAWFSDGTSQDVTGSAVWSENSAFAAFDSSVEGRLTAQAVTSNQSVTVTASYTYSGVTKSGTLTVTVTDGGTVHQMPYIIKNGCTFTLYTVNGTSAVTNISTGGTSVSTSVLQVNDIKIVVQNCVITENSQNIPVYEEK